MPKQVIVIGAGGHGKVVADIVEKCGDTVVGFLDDKAPEDLQGFHVIGKIADILAFMSDGNIAFALGIGNIEIRKRIMEQFNAPWYKAIHPSAIIGNGVEIGEGTAVMANAVINSGSRIGKGVIINTAATVDHDNVIDDYVHVSPGAHLGGTVLVGDCTWIGIGACVKNNVSICDNCMIGAGATVINNILSGGGGIHWYPR